MVSLERLRCGECGHRGLIVVEQKGRYARPWKAFPRVHLQVPLELPSCPQCGNVVPLGDDAARVDAAMETSTKMMAATLISTVLEDCGITARELARYLGITPEYLSALSTQKKAPSFQLYQMLLIIRKHPEVIGDLREHWRF